MTHSLKYKAVISINMASKTAVEKITKEDALLLLKTNNVPEDVVTHSKKVAELAKETAEQIKSRGHRVDVEFVETAALLHDIGRGVTHGITHGLEGGRMLSSYPRYARAVENHLGAGLTKKEAAELGLPRRDFIPRTIEEKIVAWADKHVSGGRIVAENKLVRKLPLGHPASLRALALDEEVNELAGVDMFLKKE
ncbi:Ribonuclease Y [uncultured archaeon]|nr:Ribonuclease Y [uncultured archaeon]